METRKIRMLTEVGRLEALLESLVRSWEFLPSGAERIEAEADLSPELARIAASGAGSRAWCAWRDGDRVWFYTAEIALSPSRERGKAVLRVTSYSADGELMESGWWVRGKKWSRMD